jgi:endonuclease IV
VGREKLHQFLQNPKFEHLPLILEVPGFDDTGPDAKNVEIVKELLDSNCC